MNHLTAESVNKLGPVIRCLSAFIFLCSLMAAAGMLYAVISEPFHPLSFIGGLVITPVFHISGSVVFTGYAPKYLLFSHGQK